MKSVRTLLSSLWILFAVTAAVPAQELRVFPPDKFERATKADDNGVVQWADHQEVKCPNCAGTGKAKCITCYRFEDDAPTCPECKRVEGHEAPCRACAGLGHYPDPLEKTFCPACQAKGFLLCFVCGGGGRLRVDKAKQWSACPACRGDGGWKCGTCNGERLVEVASVKPSLKDATAANLTKAIAATDQALAGLGKVTPAGGQAARKVVKEIVKQMQSAASFHPALKRTPKVLEDYMGKTYAGNNFMGHEDNEAEAMKSVKESAEYYLKHERRMMELALKRAEANAKLEAENKGK